MLNKNKPEHIKRIGKKFIIIVPQYTPEL